MNIKEFNFKNSWFKNNQFSKICYLFEFFFHFSISNKLKLEFKKEHIFEIKVNLPLHLFIVVVLDEYQNNGKHCQLFGKIHTYIKILLNTWYSEVKEKKCVHKLCLKNDKYYFVKGMMLFKITVQYLHCQSIFLL